MLAGQWIEKPKCRGSCVHSPPPTPFSTTGRLSTVNVWTGPDLLEVRLCSHIDLAEVRSWNRRCCSTEVCISGTLLHLCLRINHDYYVKISSVPTNLARWYFSLYECPIRKYCICFLWVCSYVSVTVTIIWASPKQEKHILYIEHSFAQVPAVIDIFNIQLFGNSY